MKTDLIEHACIAIVIATVLIAMAICSNAQDRVRPVFKGAEKLQRRAAAIYDQ
jgi:Flp pilus assembly pilin Flp